MGSGNKQQCGRVNGKKSKGWKEYRDKPCPAAEKDSVEKVEK